MTTVEEKLSNEVKATTLNDSEVKVTTLDDTEVKEENKPAESLEDNDDDQVIKLVSKSGKSYDVKKKHAYISELVKTSFTDKDATELPLPNVKDETLEKIVEYMNHHKGKLPPEIEKPLKSTVMKEVCVDQWDAEYIDKIAADKALLYDMISSSNYMDIKRLLHLGCAKVACLIKGQPKEKIKEILGYKEETEKTEKTETDKEKVE